METTKLTDAEKSAAIEIYEAAAAKARATGVYNHVHYVTLPNGRDVRVMMPENRGVYRKPHYRVRPY